MASKAPARVRKKGQPLDDEAVRSVIEHKIAQSIGSGKTGDLLTSDRLKAMRYYKGEPLGDEIEGSSKVISRDVAESVDAMMPSLMKIFTSGEDVATFTPRRPQDEDEAQQRTDYVTWIWAQQNPGYLTFHTWIKDALLNRLGTIKIWWDASIHEEREEYEGLTSEQLMKLLEDDTLELQELTPVKDDTQALEPAAAPIPSTAPQLPSPTGQPVGGGQPMQGGPPQPPQGPPQPQLAGPGQQPPQLPQQPPPDPLAGFLFDVVFRRIHDESQVKVMPVPCDETLIARQSGSTDRPWGNRRRTMVGDLIEEFPDKRDVILSLPYEGEGQDAERLERFNEEGTASRDEGGEDLEEDLTRHVWVVDAYIKLDVDGDGYAEFRKITTVGLSPDMGGSASSAILENVEYDDNPFFTLSPILMPHKLVGMSIADQTIDLQEIKTTLLRQGLNNVYRQNGSEVFTTGRMDFDALLNRRPGNVIRGEVNSTLQQLTVEPMLADIMGAIEYVDGVRDSRTGAPRNAAGPGADTLNNAFTQTLGGANMVETASQERTAFYARTFAETGVKAAMQRIDELVCKHQTKKTSLKLRNKWFEFNPADWKAKIDCTVGVGLGTNNQAIKTGQLSSLMTQVYLPIATLQQGLNGPVLDVKSVSHAGKKLVQSMGFKDADSFFPDPESIPAPAAPQQQPSPQEITAQASVKTTQMKNDHDLAKTHLTLQSQERLEQLRQAVARELGYAKIAVDNKAIDAEVALKHSQHATDTAFRNHDAHLATRESNRADAQAQHDAQHDTAQLTQTGSHFAAEHGLKHATLAHTKADSNRTFGAANPNYQDPEIVPEPPKPRKMISMGVSHDADGILAATHRHFDDGSMETIPITRGSTPKPGAAA